MSATVLPPEQSAFIEVRRRFTVRLWETFSEVRHAGYPDSRWNYNLLGRTGQEITGQEQHEIDGQQAHVKATFSQNEKDYVFTLCLTNGPGWDLIITIKTGVGPNRVLTLNAPYEGLNNASEEVRNTLWQSLDVVGRARKPTSSHSAPKSNDDNWVKQLSRLTTSFLTKRIS